MKVLNLGSLNIDKVYSVPHFVKEGETLSSLDYNEYAGGKGLNQSIALAKAGVQVYHAGRIGEDGKFLKGTLNANGVNTEFVHVEKTITGHAIIQVDQEGSNCILLFGGANQEITKEQIDNTLAKFDKGDYIVLQNEISNMKYIVDKAYENNMIIILNPSPLNEVIHRIDLSKVGYLILNEIEGESITQSREPRDILNSLHMKYPDMKIVLTLGKKGVCYKDKEQELKAEAYVVEAVDTTAAGDTFLGYFISGVTSGMDVESSLKYGSKASSIAVTRVGAAGSIPTKEEVKI